jgi:hypothetical protein
VRGERKQKSANDCLNILFFINSSRDIEINSWIINIHPCKVSPGELTPYRWKLLMAELAEIAPLQNRNKGGICAVLHHKGFGE